MIEKNDIPIAVELRVRSECLDYKRREDALKRGEATGAIRAEYERLNRVIDEALQEACDPGLIAEIRNDIANNNGWYRSSLNYLGDKTYKRIKRTAKIAIAKKLNII